MRICYIASTSIHTSRWLRYFASIGHEIHRITSEQVSSNIDGVKVHTLKRFGSRIRGINYPINSMPLYLQFRKLIKSIDPDIIHGQSIMDLTLLGAVSGFHPFIVTPWGSDVLIAPQKSVITGWIIKYIIKKADLITCDAEHIKETLVELGADSQKIKYINFGTDVEKFKPYQQNKKLRKKLGLQNLPIVISSRRFEPTYDIESLITAMPLILGEVPETRFVLLGKGSQEAMLKELSRSLGVSDSIRFVDRVLPDKVPQYLNLADVYVSTALSDAGLSSSTAEAMACGLPVIITDFGDNGKWVEDGVNGFIIPLKSPEILASKIICLLHNKKLRGQFGKAGRQVIVERNNYEKEMGKVNELYNVYCRL